MKTSFNVVKRLVFRAALLIFVAIFCFSLTPTDKVKASAYGDTIEVQAYHTEMTVREDRKVEVYEKITVKFLTYYATMFYRSLPKENTRYTGITAACPSNSEFSFYVEDNPDDESFLDVCCVGAADYGNVWTYEISYVMEQGANALENGIHIDVIGFGWSVPLHNVTVVLNLPKAIQTQDYILYSGGYGSEGNAAGVQSSLSSDGKTLTMEHDLLQRVYSSYYDEYVTEGISVAVTLGSGVLKDYATTRIFTDSMGWLVLGLVITVGLGVLAFFILPNKQPIITVVNLTAPDQMDPMRMGKLLDGTVDNEDVTSMIYYFAHKGYLRIDFSDEDDPTLIQTAPALPTTESVHARTLFNGLFAHADRKVIAGETPFDEDTVLISVRVSDLQYKFYESADKAIKQTPKLTMYAPKSVLYYLSGGIIGALYAFLAPLFVSFAVGGDYAYFAGIAFVVPAIVVWVLGLIKENYRYKWKKIALRGMTAAQIGVMAIATLIFCGLFAGHVLTGWEKLVISLGAFAPLWLTLHKLSRTEKYRETLGQILGFKEFITVTEEDRIKFMLEENPDLYYKILPYAQVLGVTDEWEQKFASITLAPPEWCQGTRYTTFDYLIINRMMTRAMLTALARPQNTGGGSFVGRSGGGGRFGGFGGGGFGGGGGGAR